MSECSVAVLQELAHRSAVKRHYDEIALLWGYKCAHIAVIAEFISFLCNNDIIFLRSSPYMSLFGCLMMAKRLNGTLRSIPNQSASVSYKSNMMFAYSMQLNKIKTPFSKGDFMHSTTAKSVPTAFG